MKNRMTSLNAWCKMFLNYLWYTITASSIYHHIGSGSSFISNFQGAEELNQQFGSLQKISMIYLQFIHRLQLYAHHCKFEVSWHVITCQGILRFCMFLSKKIFNCIYKNVSMQGIRNRQQKNISGTRAKLDY